MEELQPWEIAEQEQYEQVTKGMDEFSNIVNKGFGHAKKSHEAVANGFVRMHRTLQQLTIGILTRTIIYLADEFKKNPSRFTDARNEASFEWLTKVADVSRDQYFPYI